MSAQLSSNDPLTIDIVESGVVSWDDLTRCVELFHYGRNENREDFSLVWRERKGTCSSKHAFLKMMADLNKLRNVQLFICIYKMNGKNTPGVDGVLKEYELDFIPEAHCMLKIDDQWADFTNTHSNRKADELQKDILTKFEIRPEQVVSEKIEFHQRYLQEWKKDEALKYSFEELWDIREKCIKALEA